jgi:hypothetical protein
MATPKDLDVTFLQAASKKNLKLKKLFELYTSREKGRNSCTVPRVRRIMKESGTDLTKDEAIEIMMTWEKGGAGRFVSGKRDQDMRFVWAWDIPSLATRVLAPPPPKGVAPAPVLDAPRTRLKLPKLPQGAIVAKGVADAPSNGSKSIFVRFKGFEIELPTDMTDVELNEAQAFIKRLQGLK